MSETAKIITRILINRLTEPAAKNTLLPTLREKPAQRSQQQTWAGLLPDEGGWGEGQNGQAAADGAQEDGAGCGAHLGPRLGSSAL